VHRRLAFCVFDNTAGSGKAIFTSVALVANTYFPVASGSAVLDMVIGVHCVLVSGAATWDVLTAK